MTDVIIIGSGPASLSAAINCVQRNKSVLVLGRSLGHSLLFAAEKVDNYLGMPDMDGEEMLNRFHKHALERGVEFKETRVSQILDMGTHYVINAENVFYEAKAIILATGINKSKGIKGEANYLGKGVSYCATCDGMLYKNKNVIVVAENEEGEEEANFLADICQEVTYIPLYQNVEHLKENVKQIKEKPLEVLGTGMKVSDLKLSDQTLSCDGIFFVKNSLPLDSLLYGLEMENKNIKVNRNMETNLPRVYASGDCTGAPYQIAKAVGEGLIAALSACSAIDKLNRETKSS